MSGFIKEFYYGNIEPQEFSPELATKLKSKLNALVEKEKALDTTLKGEKKRLISEICKCIQRVSCIQHHR